MGGYGVGVATAVLLAGALWCVPLASTVAQDAPAVTAGARVRVLLKSPGGARYTGTVAGLRSDTLLLQPEDGSDSVPLAIGKIHKLHVSRGPAFTYDLSSKTSDECTDGEGTTMVALVIAGPVIGAAIGAARPGERWVSVPPKRLLATITSRGVGLAISF